MPLEATLVIDSATRDLVKDSMHLRELGRIAKPSGAAIQHVTASSLPYITFYEVLGPVHQPLPSNIGTVQLCYDLALTEWKHGNTQGAETSFHRAFEASLPEGYVLPTREPTESEKPRERARRSLLPDSLEERALPKHVDTLPKNVGDAASRTMVERCQWLNARRWIMDRLQLDAAWHGVWDTVWQDAEKAGATFVDPNEADRIRYLELALEQEREITAAGDEGEAVGEEEDLAAADETEENVTEQADPNALSPTL